MELCRQQILEKISHFKDISPDFLQRLVCSSYPLGSIPYCGLISSFVAMGDRLFFCDTGKRVCIALISYLYIFSRHLYLRFSV